LQMLPSTTSMGGMSACTPRAMIDLAVPRRPAIAMPPSCVSTAPSSSACRRGGGYRVERRQEGVWQSELGRGCGLGGWALPHACCRSCLHDSCPNVSAWCVRPLLLLLVCVSNTHTHLFDHVLTNDSSEGERAREPARPLHVKTHRLDRLHRLRCGRRCVWIVLHQH
jgi:hypothetical protein